jgi:hypothetical protein
MAMNQPDASKRDFVLLQADFRVPPRGRLTLWVAATDTTGWGHEWVVVLWGVPGAEVRRRGFAPTVEAAEEISLRWARAAVTGLTLAECAVLQEPTLPEEPTAAPTL